MNTQPTLTKNQTLVFGVLSKSDQPLSAYTILDALRSDGLKAPLQVYRALDALVDNGIVHRLESLNAFVACNHPDCASHDSVAFMICDQCASVDEISDKKITRRMQSLAKEQRFELKKSTIELRGICQDCGGGA